MTTRKLTIIAEGAKAAFDDDLNSEKAFADENFEFYATECPYLFKTEEFDWWQQGYNLYHEIESDTDDHIKEVLTRIGCIT